MEWFIQYESSFPMNENEFYRFFSFVRLQMKVCCDAKVCHNKEGCV